MGASRVPLSPWIAFSTPCRACYSGKLWFLDPTSNALDLLESQLQTELDASRLICEVGPSASRAQAQRIYILCRVVGAKGKTVRDIPVRMVKRVEELGVDVESHSFMDRNRFQERDVRIYKHGAGEKDELSQLTRSGNRQNGLRVVGKQFWV